MVSRKSLSNFQRFLALQPRTRARFHRMLPFGRGVLFHEKRFSVALLSLLFESAGPIADPTYNHTGDVANRKGFRFWSAEEHHRSSACDAVACS